MTARLPLLLTALLLLCGSPLQACLWDYDTLRDERRGLPGIAEILSGRWEKHSAFFYEHRVRQMEKRLAAAPTDLGAWDNLAVAQEKLGQIDQAIETILKKDALKPGEYTTHANLGTFHLHKGDLDQGIAHIRKAIEINPDAHFGREKYQLQVAEYLRRAKDDPSVLDRGSFVLPILISGPGSTTLPTETDQLDREHDMIHLGRRNHHPEAIQEATNGIVGMIRFGTGVSPHLYYALGDLLAARGDKHLAYRAYRRAIEFGHPNPRRIEAAAKAVQEFIEKPGEMDAEFAAERQRAAAWVEAYHAYEKKLIDAGEDAEAEASYAAFYKAHGMAQEPLPFAISRRMRQAIWVLAAAATVPIFAIALMRLVRRFLFPRPR